MHANLFKFPPREDQRDRDMLELSRMMDRYGYHQIELWLKNLNLIEQETRQLLASDPRRI